MFRNSLLQLRRNLSYKDLRESDFQIDESGINKGSFSVSITYRVEPDFKFVARIESHGQELINTSEISISATVSPGIYLRTEAEDFSGLKEMMAGIAAWVKRIDEELSEKPLARRIEMQQRQVEEIENQLSEIPNEYFSLEEADIVRDRLDALENQMVENIRSSIENNNTADLKIRELHNEIEVLKDRLDAFTKPKWYKNFFIRAAEWTTDPTNRKLIKSGANLAKTLLIESGKPTPGTPSNDPLL